VARFGLHGALHATRPFEFKSHYVVNDTLSAKVDEPQYTEESLNDARLNFKFDEMYFMRLSRARKGYLAGWARAPYMYTRMANAFPSTSANDLFLPEHYDREGTL
jgi:hypothetical protein